MIRFALILVMTQVVGMTLANIHIVYWTDPVNLGISQLYLFPTFSITLSYACGYFHSKIDQGDL